MVLYMTEVIIGRKPYPIPLYKATLSEYLTFPTPNLPDLSIKKPYFTF